MSGNEATEDVALGTALYCENGDLTMRRCVESNNFGFFAHGTVYCVDSKVTVENCVFSDNSGEWGCALLCEGCEGNVTRCTVTDNGDGVILLDDSRMTVSECTIERNYRGVGMYGGGESVVSDCLLIGNSSGVSCTVGTVIRCKMLEGTYGVFSEAGSPLIRNSLISRNTEAGVECVSSSPTLVNCIISGNLGGDYRRGGIHCGSSSSPKLINCTVWGNRADGEGGGIQCEYSGLTAINCIVWGNSPNDVEGKDEDEAIVLSHCAVGTVLGQYTDGGGNVFGDPRLLNPWRGDFHLRPDSPCIDAGADAAAPQNDFYGDARPFGGGVDIGADEFVDGDGDFLPDYWETKFGLDPNDDGTTNPDNGGMGDTDGDFVPNIEELLRGTGPMAAPTTLYVRRVGW
jgi:parallel beta-helix repeat protein